MFHNLDILCGVGCWLVGLLAVHHVLNGRYSFLPFDVYVFCLPVLWIFLFVVILCAKRRPLKRLW